MSARDRILSKVRAAAEGQAARHGPAGIDRAGAISARLRAGAQGAPIPAAARRDGEARLAQFTEKLNGVETTVTRLATIDALPRALAEELRDRNLPAAIRMGDEPLFQGLDWGTLETSAGPGRIEEPATLSKARFGLAETGTLVLASGPDNPVTLTFLGETHFVVVRERELLPGFEDLWTRVRSEGLLPRTLNMVTGPSRSADIGQKLQLGAHGPVALHVFVLAD